MSKADESTDAVMDMMARVLSPGTGRDAAFVILGYSTVDPYSVEVTIQFPGSTSLVWTVDRDLLRVGLTKPSGMGDVAFAPCWNAPGLFLHLTLRGLSGGAVLEMRSQAVQEFLDATELLVPHGHEIALLDVEDDVSTLAD